MGNNYTPTTMLTPLPLPNGLPRRNAFLNRVNLADNSGAGRAEEGQHVEYCAAGPGTLFASYKTSWPLDNITSPLRRGPRAAKFSQRVAPKEKRSHDPCRNSLFLMARLEGFEPPTLGFEVRCSIQLSYRRGMDRGRQARGARSVYPSLRPRSSAIGRAG